VALLARAGLPYSGGFTEVYGHRIHYLEHGPTDPAGQALAGDPPVILIHGAGPGCGQWFRQIGALSKRRRVLALDSPLFGLSDLVPIDGHPTEIGARFLGGFMDALGLRRADVVGLSLGGAVALKFAGRHPGRVRRLAAIDSAGLGRALPLAWRLVLAPLLGAFLVKRGRSLRQLVFERYEVERPEHPDAPFYMAYSLAVRSKRGRAAAYQLGMRLFATWRGQREVFSDRELAEIRAPTLVVWGERDRVFPVRHGEHAARLIPDARLEVIPGAGHLSVWDAPERANDLLAGFLNRG
jgi:4,5:9,10-diseco-3-hydroxy-5,9,17-trioxoandrosta-1(10),2-diene-4-oate hydrolase